MRILKKLYEKKHGQPAPYYYDYSLWRILTKPLRKWITNTVAPRSPFNCVRIFLYRLCGFKIGKGTFIGMHCYLDDMCYDLLTIGEHCTISYGVYFSCHGHHQEHLPITIEKNVYIGMRANIISKNRDSAEQGVRIEEGAVIGACTLVNRNIPKQATAIGIPCKIMEKTHDNEESK